MAAAVGEDRAGGGARRCAARPTEEVQPLQSNDGGRESCAHPPAEHDGEWTNFKSFAELI